MKIKIPEGLQLDVQPGQETELLAKVLVTKDGYLQLETLDGKPVTEMKASDEDDQSGQDQDQDQDQTPDEGDEGGESDSEDAAPGADQSQGAAPDPSQDASQGAAPQSTGSPEVDSLLAQIGNSAAPSKGKPKAKHAVVTAQSPEEYFKKRAKARQIAKKK